MVFIPRWEKYKDKKPSGLVEVNYANEFAGFYSLGSFEEPIVTQIGASISTDNNQIVSTATSSYAHTNAGDIVLSGDFSITTQVTLTSDGAGPLFAGRSSSSGTPITALCFNYNGVSSYGSRVYGSRVLAYTFRDDSGYLVSGSSGVTFDLDKKYIVTAQRRGGRFYLYVNGALYVNRIYNTATVSITNDYTTLFSDQLWVDSGTSTVDNRYLTDAYVDLVSLANRSFSLEEVQAFHENPYQILKPRQSFFVFGATAGTQTLTPSVVTNTNTFETATVTTQNTLTASVVTNTSSFHSVSVSASNSLQPSVVTNSQTFHDVTLTTSNSIVVDLYANSSSFHSATVTPYSSLQAPLVTNSQSFYGADVTPSNNLQTPLLTNTQTFHTHVVSLEGSQVVAPNLFTNSQSFYGATITAGAVSLTPALVTNNQTFYAANVSVGAIVLTPETVINTQSFYNPTVTTDVAIQPNLFTNSQTFHSPVVSLEGAKVLAPSLVSNTSAFYSATVTTGSVALLPSLVNNTTTFHTVNVIQVDVLEPTLVSSIPSFYTHVVSVGAATLNPSLFSNSNVFYSADVALGAALQTLQPPLITNTNVFYNGTVTFDQTLDTGLVVNQPMFYEHLIFDTATYKEIIEFSVSFKMEDIHAVNITQIQDFNIGL